jgi:hypothetical protein
MKQRVRGLLRPAMLGSAAGLAIAAIVMAALPIKAIGADAPDPSDTGATHPDDLVLARQLLMDSNETLMLTVNPAQVNPAVTLATLKADAYAIYTNLTVAPHLFPSSTKPVTAADGTVTPSTAAAPGIWDNFDAFYNRFTDVANLAYDMSMATDINKFYDQAKQLRMDCDACHAKNMNVFDPTKQP